MYATNYRREGMGKISDVINPVRNKVTKRNIAGISRISNGVKRLKIKNQRIVLSLFFYFSFLSFLLLFFTSAPFSQPLIKSGALFEVEKVIDGDTILLTSGQKVRYIGVDTPETKHPRRKVEYLGKEAYYFNKNLVEGKKVGLEFDVQKKDKYGRWLAYVYVDDIFVNAHLIAEGYALVYTVPPNVKYQELFLKLQREARESQKGLWAEKKSNDVSAENKYIASQQREPFHYAWCQWAQKISPYNKREFSTREEAIKAGHRPCKVCRP